MSSPININKLSKGEFTLNPQKPEKSEEIVPNSTLSTDIEIQIIESKELENVPTPSQPNDQDLKSSTPSVDPSKKRPKRSRNQRRRLSRLLKSIIPIRQNDQSNDGTQKNGQPIEVGEHSTPQTETRNISTQSKQFQSVCTYSISSQQQSELQCLNAESGADKKLSPFEGMQVLESEKSQKVNVNATQSATGVEPKTGVPYPTALNTVFGEPDNHLPLEQNDQIKYGQNKLVESEVSIPSSAVLGDETEPTYLPDTTEHTLEMNNPIEAEPTFDPWRILWSVPSTSTLLKSLKPLKGGVPYQIASAKTVPKHENELTYPTETFHNPSFNLINPILAESGFHSEVEMGQTQSQEIGSIPTASTFKQGKDLLKSSEPIKEVRLTRVETLKSEIEHQMPLYAALSKKIQPIRSPETAKNVSINVNKPIEGEPILQPERTEDPKKVDTNPNQSGIGVKSTQSKDIENKIIASTIDQEQDLKSCVPYHTALKTVSGNATDSTYSPETKENPPLTMNNTIKPNVGPWTILRRAPTTSTLLKSLEPVKKLLRFEDEQILPKEVVANTPQSEVAVETIQSKVAVETIQSKDIVSKPIELNIDQEQVHPDSLKPEKRRVNSELPYLVPLRTVGDHETEQLFPPETDNPSLNIINPIKVNSDTIQSELVFKPTQAEEISIPSLLEPRKDLLKSSEFIKEEFIDIELVKKEEEQTAWNVELEMPTQYLSEHETAENLHAIINNSIEKTPDLQKTEELKNVETIRTQSEIEVKPSLNGSMPSISTFVYNLAEAKELLKSGVSQQTSLTTMVQNPPTLLPQPVTAKKLFTEKNNLIEAGQTPLSQETKTTQNDIGDKSTTSKDIESTPTISTFSLAEAKLLLKSGVSHQTSLPAVLEKQTHCLSQPDTPENLPTKKDNPLEAGPHLNPLETKKVETNTTQPQFADELTKSKDTECIPTISIFNNYSAESILLLKSGVSQHTSLTAVLEKQTQPLSQPDTPENLPTTKDNPIEAEPTLNPRETKKVETNTTQTEFGDDPTTSKDIESTSTISIFDNYLAEAQPDTSENLPTKKESPLEVRTSLNPQETKNVETNTTQTEFGDDPTTSKDIESTPTISIFDNYLAETQPDTSENLPTKKESPLEVRTSLNPQETKNVETNTTQTEFGDDPTTSKDIESTPTISIFDNYLAETQPDTSENLPTKKESPLEVRTSLNPQETKKVETITTQIKITDIPSQSKDLYSKSTVSTLDQEQDLSKSSNQEMGPPTKRCRLDKAEITHNSAVPRQTTLTPVLETQTQPLLQAETAKNLPSEKINANKASQIVKPQESKETKKAESYPTVNKVKPVQYQDIKSISTPSTSSFKATGVKRLREDDIEPQPAAKREEPPSDKRGANILVGLICSNFPAGFMDNHQINLLKKAVMDAIIKMPKGGPQVRFYGCKNRFGWLQITCVDWASVKWLERTVKELKPWKGADLLLVKGKDLPKRNICHAYIPKKYFKKNLDSEDVLSTLKNMNHDLRTDAWFVMDQEESNRNFKWTFSVDNRSMEALRGLNFRPYFGFSKINFEPISNRYD